MKSKIVPYIVAGSTIGGAVAFLLMTDKGRRMSCSLRKFDANTIPDKMEKLRDALEKRADQVSKKLEDVRSATRLAYGESDDDLRKKLRQVEETNGRVTAGIHKSVDDLNRTVYGMEKAVLASIYQVMSIAASIKRGVFSLKEREPRNVTPVGF